MLRKAIAGVLLAVATGCGGSGAVTGPSVEPTPSPTPTVAAPETWIIWGQSNALGCAEPPLYVGRPEVTAWDPRTSAWVPAREILPFMVPHTYCSAIGGSGWAVLAANMMGRPVRLTGHAEGGQNIEHWSDSPQLLTRNLTAATDAAWMIAYQGEADTGPRTRYWLEEFRSLVAAVRAATNPQLRVLVIGLADEPSRTTQLAPGSYALLRAQQRAYAASDPLARFITAEGCERQPAPGDAHLSRQGYEQLAVRVVAAIRGTH